MQGAGQSLGKLMSPGVLSGITFSLWLRLLAQNRFHISPRYWLRALGITLLSMVNSLVGRWEDWRMGGRWENVEPDPPLFVIGLARSGTTHLHNMLSVNPDFACPNIVEARFPRTFLTLGPFFRRLTPLFFGRRRAQDNVEFGPDSPAEEESALACMSLCSHLFSIVFPCSRQHYSRFRFSHGFTSEETKDWQEAFTYLVKKLSWKYRRRLVLKNPAHTARLELLIDTFPGARFVFIHRHPHDVVQSRLHAERAVDPYWQLQAWASTDKSQLVARCGGSIKTYLDVRDRVSPGHLVEVGYDQLEKDPVDTIRYIYKTLDIAQFEKTETALKQYLESLGKYEKNRHQVLERSVREQLSRDFPEWYETWGYEKSEPGQAK